MDADWIKAIEPLENVAIAGVRLRRYSIGHEVLLQRLGSPFTFGGLPTVHDLFLGCAVCSQSYENAIRAVGSWYLSIYARCWRWKAARIDPNREIVSFGRYREAGLWTPDVNIPSRGRLLKSPWLIRLAAMMASEFHMPLAEVMNCPVALANALYFARADYKEEIDLTSELDLELVRKARDMEIPKEFE